MRLGLMSERQRKRKKESPPGNTNYIIYRRTVTRERKGVFDVIRTDHESEEGCID